MLTSQAANATGAAKLAVTQSPAAAAAAEAMALQPAAARPGTFMKKISDSAVRH